MTRESHYSEAFWGTEFCSSAGYETLSKHMKDGRTTCKCLANFIRQRSKIEEDYAKTIDKLNKGTDFNLEIGTLRASAEQLKTSTDQMVQEHLNASRILSERAQYLDDFANDQKKARLKEEAALQRQTTVKNQAYSKAADAKKKYHLRSLEAEQAGQAKSEAIQSRNNLPTNKFEKIVSNAAKTSTAAKAAEENYQQNISALDDERDKWERRMYDYAKFCEEQDVDRIRALHGEIWTFCNTTSSSCVADDQSCEDVRVSLEKVNVTADLEEFIDRYKTGTERPAPVTLEPYISPNCNKSTMPPSPSMRSATISVRHHLPQLKTGTLAFRQ